MDHLSYYPMPKDPSFLKVDGSAGPDGYALPPEDMGIVSFMNEENSPKNGTKSSLYKTELCKRFSEFGNCRYGAKCQFAHGITELRHVVRHPKYKTTKCKSYWGSGHCPYGSRCRFIHEETEGYSQPQFSPPSNLGAGMFLREKDFLSGLGTSVMAPPPPSVDLSYGGGIYCEHSSPQHLQQHIKHHRHHQAMSSFSKDNYSLLPSLEDGSSWGAPTMNASSPLHPNYAGNNYDLKQQRSLGSIGISQAKLRAISIDTSKRALSPGYPDLQDAIDALVKFSLTPEENTIPDTEAASKASSKQAGGDRELSDASSPDLDSASTALTKIIKADFSMQSSELWKDFSAVSPASFVGDDVQEQPWSSRMQSRSLDRKAFDSVVAASSEARDASGSSSNDEESPRLSVFERFH